MTTSTVLPDNHSQAVCLSADSRLPADVVKVDGRGRIHGKESTISSVGQTWDSFFLNGPTVSDDFLQERTSQEQAAQNAF